MRKLTRKFVAVLLMLWLPLSMGSALASVITMQMQHGDRHELTIPGMQNQDMGVQVPHHGQHLHRQTDKSCNGCGTCHLACNAYMTASHASAPAMLLPAQEYVPQLVSYESVSTIPLLPPPLARA